MPRKGETSTADPESPTGTYVWDERLKAVVRVSDRVPGVASKGRRPGASAEPAEAQTCGRPRCGGGSCGAPGADWE